MKECNNCGYQKLLDHAKKCKCGAVEKPSFILAILTVMFKVAFITVFEILILSSIWYVYFLVCQDILFMVKSDVLSYSLIAIYITQCVIYAIINKTFHTDPNTITTTFTKIEENESFETPRFTHTSSTTSKSNSDDGLLTGIVIGAVATHILSSDDDSHHSRSSSTEDGYGYSDSFGDSGGDCGGGGD